MSAPGYVRFSIAGEVIGTYSNLRRNKFCHVQGDNFPGGQQASWVAKRAKLKGKTETVMGISAGSDVLNVIVCQCVVAQQLRLQCRKVKQGSALTLGQNVASWHARLSLLVISL